MEIHQLDQGVSMGERGSLAADEPHEDDRAARTAEMARKMAADLDARHGSPSLHTGRDEAKEAATEAVVGHERQAADESDEWGHLTEPSPDDPSMVAAKEQEPSDDERASAVFVVDATGATDAVAGQPEAPMSADTDEDEPTESAGSDEATSGDAQVAEPTIQGVETFDSLFEPQVPTGDDDFVADGFPEPESFDPMNAETYGNEVNAVDVPADIGAPRAPIEETQQVAEPVDPAPWSADAEMTSPQGMPSAATVSDVDRISAAGIAQLADEMMASVITIQGSILEEREKQEASRAQIPAQVDIAVAERFATMAGDLNAHRHDITAAVKDAERITGLRSAAEAQMTDISATSERVRAQLEVAHTQGETFARFATDAKALIDQLTDVGAKVRGDLRTLSSQVAVARVERERISAIADWAADAPEVINEHLLSTSDEVRELERMRTDLEGAGGRLRTLIDDAEARVANLESEATEAMGAASALVDDLRAGANGASERVNEIGVRSAEDATELRDTFTKVMEDALVQMRSDAHATRAAADQARAGAIAITDGLNDLLKRAVAEALRAHGIGAGTAIGATPPSAQAPAATAPDGLSTQTEASWDDLKRRMKALHPRMSAQMVSEASAPAVQTALQRLRTATTKDEFRAAVEGAERLFPDVGA